jgi:hypothetical protein
VTGTSKDFVAMDYMNILDKGIEGVVKEIEG